MGHGRLLRGLTPQQATDAVLSDGHPGIGEWIDADAVMEAVAAERRMQPLAYLPSTQATVALEVYVEAVRRLERAQRSLLLAEVCCAVSGTACAALVGLRLLGL